jgi:hypothetical protein
MALRLPASRAGRPLPPGRLGIDFCYGLSLPQGHSAAGKIRSTEKSNDFNGNWTRDHPASSIVPQPTTLPRAPVRISSECKELLNILELGLKESESRCSSVDLVTGYGLDGRCSAPGKGKPFLFSTMSRLTLWGPPSFLSNGYRG